MIVPRPLLEKIAALANVVQRDRALKPIEQTLARKMVVAFRAHRTVFMREFERVGPRILGEASTLPAIEGALEAAYQATLADFLAPIEEAAGAAIAAAAKHRVAEFGVGFAFDLKNPRAVQAIKDRGAAAVTEIDATTRDEIARIITQGMEDGYNYQQVARQIVAKYDEFGVGKPQAHIRNRAELIAVTEAAEAYETGNRLVVDEMTAIGLEMEKAWSTVGDERVSEGCIANAAVGWIPVDQAFPSGHQHAPRFPGCRCAVLYRRNPAPHGAT
jgi:hypothetical protein